MTITAYEAKQLADSSKEAHNKRIAPLYAQIRVAATEGKRQIATIGITSISGMHVDGRGYTGEQADAIVAELKSAGFWVRQESKKGTVWGDDEPAMYYYYVISW